jgi:Tfp pilus assembly protein PilF
MNRWIGCVVAAWLLGGCIGGPPVATMPPRAPVGAPSEDPQQPPPSNASTMLLEQGQAELDAGRFVEATTSIERALRIDPNNPELWVTLGEIKWESGDRQQAAMMGRKALTLAAGDRNIETRASRLIRSR